MGYVPSAMRNYLARLGWSHGDSEIFSTEQAIEWFDLNAIGRSASRFDFAKLENLNGHYIRHTSDAELVAQDTGLSLRRWKARKSSQTASTSRAGRSSNRPCPALRSAPRRLSSFCCRPATFSFPRPLDIDEKAAKLLEGDARKHLAVLHERFSGLESWEPAALEAATRAYAEEAGVKLGGVAQPLRAALTGRTTSPPIFDVLTVLGRDEALARIADKSRSARSCPAAGSAIKEFGGLPRRPALRPAGRFCIHPVNRNICVSTFS